MQGRYRDAQGRFFTTARPTRELAARDVLDLLSRRDQSLVDETYSNLQSELPGLTPTDVALAVFWLRKSGKFVDFYEDEDQDELVHRFLLKNGFRQARRWRSRSR